jgi:hypothetical protein
MKKYFTFSLIQTISLVIVLVGVVASLGLVLYNGRNNKSVLLIALFVGWVLSPFIALLITHKVSKRWTDFARKILYSLMLVIPISSLLGYSGVLSPAGTKTAFVFLVVPLISWVLIAIFLLIARSQNK